MKNINSKLVSETFTQLSCQGDFCGINYYRDSLLERNDLSHDELKTISIIATVSLAFAHHVLAINSMRKVSLAFKSYMGLEHAEQ